MTYATLLTDTDTDNGVRTITLNRPDKLNAVTTQMTTDLHDALRLAARDPAVRCLVLTGAGRGFCAGQDVGEMGDIVRGDGETPHLGDDLRHRYNPIIRALRTIEKPVIAAVNGVAAGAGLGFALACDLRIAAVSASFVSAFVKIGLVPDAGSAALLPLLVGIGKASELAFTGERVGADEALRLGMVNRVVPDGELAAVTYALATQLAAMPTRAIGLTKRAFNHTLLPHLDAMLEYEADLQEIAGRTADHAEGVAAFLAKRPAKFRGE